MCYEFESCHVGEGTYAWSFGHKVGAVKKRQTKRILWSESLQPCV